MILGCSNNDGGHALQENSISADYVTEKLFDAFAGGCVPIYLGAPNIEAFLPDPDAIVDMR